MPTFVNIEDLRRAAKWNLPKAIFDFVDGGANAEWTMRRNQSAFERILFDPRVLRRRLRARPVHHRLRPADEDADHDRRRPA